MKPNLEGLVRKARMGQIRLVQCPSLAEAGADKMQKPCGKQRGESPSPLHNLPSHKRISEGDSVTFLCLLLSHCKTSFVLDEGRNYILL